MSRPQPPQKRYPTRRPTKQPVSQSQCSLCLCVVPHPRVCGFVQPTQAYAAEMPSLVTTPTAADAKPDGLSNKTSDAAADDQDTDKGAHKGAHHRSYRCICAARVDSSPAAASARNSSQQQHMHLEPPANSLEWGKARVVSQPAPPASASLRVGSGCTLYLEIRRNSQVTPNAGPANTAVCAVSGCMLSSHVCAGADALSHEDPDDESANKVPHEGEQHAHARGCVRRRR